MMMYVVASDRTNISRLLISFFYAVTLFFFSCCGVVLLASAAEVEAQPEDPYREIWITNSVAKVIILLCSASADSENPSE